MDRVKGGVTWSRPWTLLLVLALLVMGGVEENPGPSLATDTENMALLKNPFDTRNKRESSFKTRSSVMYTKLASCADMSGTLYEVKMAALLFLRGLNRTYVFHLAANMDAAGCFDDIVFKYKMAPDGEYSTTFLQLKHKQRAKVTQPALLAIKHDFSLTKYCNSYYMIKSDYPNSMDLKGCGDFDNFRFVIYTNAKVDSELLKKRKIKDFPGPDCLLRTGGSEELAVSFDKQVDEDIFQSLREMVDFKELLSRLKDMEEEEIKEELDNFVVSAPTVNNFLSLKVKMLQKHPSKVDIVKTLNEMKLVADVELYEEFLGKLQVYTSQANEKELDLLIKNEIADACSITDKFELEKMFEILLKEIQNWWGNDSCFLTNESSFWKNIIIGIITELSFEKTSELGNKVNVFNEKELKNLRNIIPEFGILNIITKDGPTSLSMSKIYQTSRKFHGNCIIFIGLEKLLNHQDKVLSAWKTQWCRTLIVECDIRPSQESFHNLCSEIQKILEDTKTLIRCIFVSKSNDTFAKSSYYYTPHYNEYEDANLWSQLSEECQERLLAEKVHFQGYEVSLDMLVKNNNGLTSHLKGGALTQLLETTLEVGPTLDSSPGCYIPRKLSRDLIIDIESPCDIPERVVLITAEPGMGKSTLLTHLALMSKREDPTKWVVRVNLNDCSTYLNDLKLEDINSMEAMKFMMRFAVGTNSDVEKILLKHCLLVSGMMVVLLDGVDEVCPYYEDKVCSLLKNLLSTKIQSFWITSRLVLKEKLEQLLKITSFSLEPFTKSDQVCFLTSFWRSIQPSIDDSQLRDFTDKVMALAFQAFKGDDLVISIPQQTRMLGEYFEKDMNCFTPETGFIQIPKKLNLILLYESFILKKFETYNNEKKKVDKVNAAVLGDSENIYQSFLNDHMEAALILLISAEDYKHLGISDENTRNFMERVIDGRERTGIIGNFKNKKPHFVHRTFGEYFAALWFTKNFIICRDFLRCKMSEPQLEVVVTFFDRILAKDCDLHNAVLSRDLNTVKELISSSKVDIDQIDIGGRTALHLAASYKGTKQIAEILLEHGASVTIQDYVMQWRPLQYSDASNTWCVAGLILQRGGKRDDMASAKRTMSKELYNQFLRFTLRLNPSYASLLHLAARNGDLRIVEYLVEEHNADLSTLDEEGAYPMHRAAEGGSIEMMRYLQSRGTPYNVQDRNGNTTLLSACKYGQLAVIEFLIGQGASVNDCNKDGWSCLMYAAEHGSVSVMEVLISHGAAPGGADVRSVDQVNAALLCASFEGNLEMSMRLVAQGASVNHINWQGMMPLHWAVLSGNSILVEYFLEQKAVVHYSDAYGTSLLHQVSKPFNSYGQQYELANGKRRLEIAKLLVEKKVNLKSVTNEGETVIDFANKNCHSDLVSYFKRVIQEKVKQEEERSYLLFVVLFSFLSTLLVIIVVSCSLHFRNSNRNVVQFDKHCHNVFHTEGDTGNRGMLRFLYETKPPVSINALNENKISLLTAVASRYSWDVVRCLVTYHADLQAADQQNKTALHFAVENNNINITGFLIDHGADVNTIDNDGNTPLMIGAQTGSIELARFIVGYNADVNVRNIYGQTALHIAVNVNRVHMVMFLLVVGATTSDVDGEGRTALLIATENDRLEIIEELVGHGADIEATDRNGRTALVIAVDHDNVAIVKYLLMNNALTSHADGKGRFPLIIATERNNTGVLNELLAHRADTAVADTEGRTAVIVATEKGHVGVLASLLSFNASTKVADFVGRSPVVIATANRDLEALKLLVASGAEFSKVADKEGRAPILIATENEDSETVRYLVEHRVNLNAADVNGRSALVIAGFKGNYAIVKYLVESGANIKAADVNGQTALQFALKNNSTDIVRYLRDEKGATW